MNLRQLRAEAVSTEKNEDSYFSFSSNCWSCWATFGWFIRGFDGIFRDRSKTGFLSWSQSRSFLSSYQFIISLFIISASYALIDLLRRQTEQLKFFRTLCVLFQSNFYSTCTYFVLQASDFVLLEYFTLELALSFLCWNTASLYITISFLNQLSDQAIQQTSNPTRLLCFKVASRYSKRLSPSSALCLFIMIYSSDQQEGTYQGRFKFLVKVGLWQRG